MKRSSGLKRVGFQPRAAGAQSTLKRTELKRTELKRGLTTMKPGGQLARQGKPKVKKCANRSCRAPYEPDPKQPWKDWCSDDCAVVIALARIEKQKATKAKTERAEDRRKADKLKTRSDWLKEAQRAFNAFIRARDRLAGHACICCGVPLDWTGNKTDAGHYRSVGSAPHLRFNELNVWAQSKQCNRFGAGRAVDYRLGLIQRIGLDAVEALEADQEPRKYDIEELKAIKTKYQAKVRELKRSIDTD